MQSSIRLEHAAELSSIVLVAPASKPPTLDHTTLGELEAAISELTARRPHAVVLQSSESKYFCVGANLNVLKDLDAESIVPWVMLGHRVLNRLEELPCPVVAQVSGYAMGGGLELAMACDLIIAEAGAKFAQSEAGLGFIPGWGGTQRLAERVGVPRAKRIFFTGQTLDAETACAWGLVDLVAEPGALPATVQELIRTMTKNSASALATFKRIVNNERRGARERCAAVEALESRGCLRDNETQQRITAFFNRRK